MPFALKENEAEARERLRAFWSGRSLGRPALYAVADRPGFVETPFHAWPGGSRAPEPSKENDLTPAWHAWRAEQFLASAEFLAEAMPGAVVRWGALITTLAMWAGGDYEYHSESGWIKRMPDLYERPPFAFDPAAPMTQAMKRCYEGVAQTVESRGYISAPIMLDALTTMSSFRTPPQLCLDCIERPDDVRRVSDNLTTLYLDGYDDFYRMLAAWGYPDTSSWLLCMAESKAEAVQCDFAVMLSPAMFERFALPDLRRVTDYMDYSLYHLDGVCQMRFLDLLCTLPKLNGIQWNPEPPAGSPALWLDAFRAIRDRGLALYVTCNTVDEALVITRSLGPDGLMLVLPRFASRHEAEQAIREIERACQ